MAVEITPEPSEEERQAILRALELEREEADEPSPWRHVALGEGEPAGEDAGPTTPVKTRRAGGEPHGKNPPRPQ